MAIKNKAVAVAAPVEGAEPTDTPKALAKAAKASEAVVANAKATADKVGKPKPVAEPVAVVEVAEVEGDADEHSTGETFARKDIAESIRASLSNAGIGVSSKVALAMVIAYEGVIASVIEIGGGANLPGFGKFQLKPRAGGTRRNPKTGETFEVAPRWSVSFKVGRTLKDAAAGLAAPEFEEASETEPATAE